MEFRSKLEDLMPAEELIFEPTPGFGPYKRFLEHAIAHPAKMNTKLLKFLIKNFTQQDDVILDPMCGSGSTGVVAALHGRNAVQVDIEKKFVDWAEEAKRKVEAQATLTAKGLIRNICGDSRKLSELLKEADVVVTSPPYSETIHKRADYSKRVERLEGKGIDFQSLGKSVQLQDGEEYVKSEGNIANLPHGEISGYSPNKDNIGNLKSKDQEYETLVDSIITSPPYAHESSAAKPTKLEKQGLFKMGHSSEEAYTDEDYREWNKHKGGNIGKRKLFIRIPCGKEEAQFYDTRKGRKGTIWEYTSEVEATPEIIEQVQQLKSERKGKSETYLEAMLKCYQEMFKVLKPDGKAIIVIKPFIRNKKVVDLPYHTWLLLEKVGFKLVKLFKLRLQQESFWRILYSQKFPKVPKIAHEWILICEKP